MFTRLGTQISGYQGKPDADGYIVCELQFGDDPNKEYREVHIGDLRTENEQDRMLLDRWCTYVAELQSLKAKD